MNQKIEQKYKQREGKYRSFHEKISLKTKKLVIFKLISIFGGVGASIVIFLQHHYYLGTGILGAILIIYLYLNIQHDKALYYQHSAECMMNINRKGVRRLNGEWTAFSDKGEDLSEPEHFYAGDLDITGQGSVFQYINCCTTPWGRKILKKWLFSHPGSIEEIRGRQESVCEMAEKLSFRQRLQGEGLRVKGEPEGIENILEFASKVNNKLLDKKMQIMLHVLPAITFLLIIAAILQQLPYVIPTLLVAAQIVLLKWKGKKRAMVLNTAYAFKYHLEPYQNMLRQIEKGTFQSSLLKDLKESLYMNNTAPSAQLGKLSRICSNISNRNNMFYFLFNILTLWDYQCESALEKWKMECGKHLVHWFEGIGTFEAISSLSVLKYENPEWVIPDVTNSEKLVVNGVRIGHPLITKNRVVNNFEMGGARKVVLVTGSNMSGKSTFLRTIGLNLVLAYAGAPVCAEYFSCSRMNVHTCMRISDNLEKNISSFYAELLRIKMIVDAVKSKGRIFFLLDEIFKGTNSYDRHHAAKVLITKLANNNSIGLVSTHDLELEVLQQETNGQIANFHFQEHYEQGKIKFDYKLRPGVSTTRNALYLIEALGIEI